MIERIHVLMTTIALSLLIAGCQTAKVNQTLEDRGTESGERPSSEAVSFKSADDVVIVGTLYAASKDKSPAVLLLHQWQSDRRAYDSFAKRLQSKGFTVLAIDGRGFGESVKTTDGRPFAAARDEAAVRSMLIDVANAVKFLSGNKRVDPQRIAIVGASYGSSLAIMFAAENKEVKAVALLSPGINYFGNMRTEPAVKNFGDRALLLLAAEDDSESAAAVRRLKEVGANDSYVTEIYPKGGHGTALFSAGVGLEDRLAMFLERSLK